MRFLGRFRCLPRAAKMGFDAQAKADQERSRRRHGRDAGGRRLDGGLDADRHRHAGLPRLARRIWYFNCNPDVIWIGALGGVLYFTAVLAAVVSLVLVGVVVRGSRTPPPLAITIFSLIVAAGPLLAVAIARSDRDPGSHMASVIYRLHSGKSTTSFLKASDQALADASLRLVLPNSAIRWASGIARPMPPLARRTWCGTERARSRTRR